MYRCAVVDDVSNDLLLISHQLLKAAKEKNINIKVDQYQHDLNNLKKCFYHILFLDIDMSTINGIKLAQEYLNQYPESMIVFITNHNELVYDVFDVRPYAFIQKQQLLKKISPCLIRLIKILDDRNKIIIIDNNKILINDILYLESDGHYINIYTNKKSFRTRAKLKTIFDQINSNDFTFCHKSYLVNLNYVTKYKNNSIDLLNLQKLPVSRKRANEFIDAYQKHLARRF